MPRRTNAEARDIGELESMFLARIDGRRTIGDIADLLSLGRAEASWVVRRLVELGLVELDG